MRSFAHAAPQCAMRKIVVLRWVTCLAVPEMLEEYFQSLFKKCYPEAEGLDCEVTSGNVYHSAGDNRFEVASDRSLRAKLSESTAMASRRTSKTAPRLLNPNRSCYHVANGAEALSDACECC